jgi:ACS family allantoate permease-like MFS transporter
VGVGQISVLLWSLCRIELEKMTQLSVDDHAEQPQAEKEPTSTLQQTPAQEKPTGPNADAALELIAGVGSLGLAVDPETNKRLLRKIDLHILPLICIIYFLQYIDKTAISYASVTGLRESANLHGNQFVSETVQDDV